MGWTQTRTETRGRNEGYSNVQLRTVEDSEGGGENQLEMR